MEAQILEYKIILSFLGVCLGNQMLHLFNYKIFIKWKHYSNIYLKKEKNLFSTFFALEKKCISEREIYIPFSCWDWR